MRAKIHLRCKRNTSPLPGVFVAMTHRYTLERIQTVTSELTKVTHFFEDPGNLEALTPSFLNFRIDTKGELEMKEGAIIDYRIALHGLPMKWRTRILQYTPGADFVDFQVKGPYKYWHHLHTFRSTPQGTEILDRVTYELPFGPLGRIAHAFWVRRQLGQIFDFRAKVVEERFGRP